MTVWVSDVVLIFTIFPISPQLIENYGPCNTPKEESGFCINLDQCSFLNNIVYQKPLSEKDKEFLKKSQCGMQNSTVVICCSDHHINLSKKLNLIPEPGICGRVNQGRIYGGNETQLDEYPSMALIEYIKFEESMGHHCGGSLINNRYVLTAAHCLKQLPTNWEPIRIRLGEWDTKTDPDCQTDVNGHTYCADIHSEVMIEKVIIHPNYELNSKNRFSDIALIRLSRSIAFTDFIAPICLPLNNNLKFGTFEVVVMDVVGWGKTEKGFPKSDIKLKASMPVIPLEDCHRVYQSASLGKWKKDLKASQICAGGEMGVDSCRGDSGGPLVALDRSNKSQVYFFYRWGYLIWTNTMWHAWMANSVYKS